MKTIMKIVGILLILFNGIYILWGLSMIAMSSSYGINISPGIIVIFVIPFIVGIVLVKKSKK